MRKKYYAAAVLVILITAGCSHYGAIDKNWGKSYDSATSGQILNPQASKNLKPETGLNGNAADAAMKKYVNSFSVSSQTSQGPQGFALTPIVPTEGAGMGQNVYGK
jgi:hypothetical protein